MVLVDSSIWIDLLRGRTTAQVTALRRLLESNDAALTPVVYQEILQGAASPDGFAKLREYFRSLPFLLPAHPIETYAAAAEMYFAARRQGITPRSPHDCLVARIAVEHAVPLLHDDRDFEALACIERRSRSISLSRDRTPRSSGKAQRKFLVHARNQLLHPNQAAHHRTVERHATRRAR